MTLPPEALVPLLADARRRGQPFPDVWPVAVADATASANGEAAAWTGALEATRGAWERSYVRQPATRADRAVSLLCEDAELVPIAETRDGRCEQCDAKIPPDRHRNARYCSRECKRAANYGRERAAA